MICQHGICITHSFEREPFELEPKESKKNAPANWFGGAGD
jgi:hypothetical protein